VKGEKMMECLLVKMNACKEDGLQEMDSDQKEMNAIVEEVKTEIHTLVF
jgi:hypothetical protein